MAEVEEQLLIRAKIDRASFTSAEQTLRRLERGPLGAFGAQTAKNVSNFFMSAASAARNLRQEIEAGNSALSQQNSILARIEQMRSGGRTRTSGGTVRNDNAETIDRLGTIGSQVAGALGGSELGNVAGLIGDFGGALSALGPVGLAAAGGMAALTVGISALNKQVEASNSTIRRALQINDQYYSAIERGTSEQIQQQIDALEQSRVVLQARADQLSNILEFTFRDLAASQGDASARLRFQLGFYSELQQAQADAASELETNIALTERLTQALDSNATALNDAAAAYEQAQEQFTQSTLEGARAIESDVRRQAQISDLSSEAARERLSTLEDERRAVQASIDYLEQWAGTNEELQAELQTLRDRMFDLNLETQQVNAALETTIAQREAEEAAAQRHEDALKRAAEARQREMQRILENVSAIGDAYNRIKDIQARAAEETAKIAADLVRREAQTAQTLADRRQDIAIDAAQDEQEAAIQNQRALARIIREGSRASLEAVGNRDALSLLQARRARDEQKEDAADESRQRKAAMEAQLKDAERTYDRQIRDARQAAYEQQAASRSKLATEVAAQRAIITTAQSALQTRVRLEAGAYGQMANNVISFVQRMAAAAAALNSVQVGPVKGTGVVKGGNNNNVDFQRLNRALRTITAD